MLVYADESSIGKWWWISVRLSLSHSTQLCWNKSIYPNLSLSLSPAACILRWSSSIWLAFSEVFSICFHYFPWHSTMISKQCPFTFAVLWAYLTAVLTAVQYPLESAAALSPLKGRKQKTIRTVFLPKPKGGPVGKTLLKSCQAKLTSLNPLWSSCWAQTIPAQRST